MERLRKATPPQRHVIFCGDGSYTNAVIIKNLPQHCTYIGRIRKDAKFHYLPEAAPQGGKLNGRPAALANLRPPRSTVHRRRQPWQRIERLCRR